MMAVVGPRMARKEDRRERRCGMIPAAFDEVRVAGSEVQGGAA